ncbi:MAG: CvpA family protein [Hyphomicrobiales bacterium]|nr:CvpA family protein [Hyphomicrobiales bacterium]
MASSISFFDTILLLLVFLSSFFAMLRGFTRETLSILSWAFATLASFVAYTNDQSRDLVEGLLQPDWLAYSILVGVTFIVILIVSAFISSKISKLVLKSNIGILDRIFGICFGFFRGYLMIMLLFLALTWLFDKDQPRWLEKSIFYDHLLSSKDRIYSYLPENPSQLIEKINFDRIEENTDLNQIEVPNGN